MYIHLYGKDMCIWGGGILIFSCLTSICSKIVPFELMFKLMVTCHHCKIHHELESGSQDALTHPNAVAVSAAFKAVMCYD